jgi:hypothetical protein
VKEIFDKGYVPNWSKEEFYISDVRAPDPRNENFRPRFVYKLKDRSGEDLSGSWYREELQPIGKNKYFIERVIRKRAASETPQSLATSADSPECKSFEYLVKWDGWPTKFNTWIPEDEIGQFN